MNVAARRDDHRGHPDLLNVVLPAGAAWTPVRAPRLETRWFVAGDLPRHLRPVVRSVTRVDSYHEPSLSPDVSVKLRGDTGRLESKVRSRAEVTSVGGVHAVVERWQKWRLHQDRPHQLSGPWIVVGKQIWTIDGIELARISHDGRTWWSLAFPFTDGRPPRSSIVQRWLGHVGDTGVPASYASWLAECSTPSQAA
jgi:hypothetical protein